MTHHPAFSLIVALPIALALATPVLSAPTDHNTVQVAQAQYPNQGTVGETINTAGYTYIKVLSNQGEQWIAVPQVSLKLGTTIRYGNGIVMQNYTSKSLKRQFPSVIFTDGLQVVK